MISFPFCKFYNRRFLGKIINLVFEIIHDYSKFLKSQPRLSCYRQSAREPTCRRINMSRNIVKPFIIFKNEFLSILWVQLSRTSRWNFGPLRLRSSGEIDTRNFKNHLGQRNAPDRANQKQSVRENTPPKNVINKTLKACLNHAFSSNLKFENFLQDFDKINYIHYQRIF